MMNNKINTYKIEERLLKYSMQVEFKTYLR